MFEARCLRKRCLNMNQSKETAKAFRKLQKEAQRIQGLKTYYKTNAISRLYKMGFSMIEINNLTKDFNFKDYVKKKYRKVTDESNRNS